MHAVGSQRAARPSQLLAPTLDNDDLVRDRNRMNALFDEERSKVVYCSQMKICTSTIFRRLDMQKHNNRSEAPRCSSFGTIPGLPLRRTTPDSGLPAGLNYLKEH
ncbi:hypothetical protein E4U61_003261, partial [Claviceps capensis]